LVHVAIPPNKVEIVACFDDLGGRAWGPVSA
jgi:hypothetical protein